MSARRHVTIFLLALICTVSNAAPYSVLVIVVDGLRPDYVTHEWMPHLYGLAQRGLFFENHHAAYPTVTRVNSPTIATGAYPGSHGLMGNQVYFPTVNERSALNTSNGELLLSIDDAIGGHLLTVPSLGEILEPLGVGLLAISSGSTGSALLLNHKAKGRGLLHPELILPESMKPRVLEALGTPLRGATPNVPYVKWAVDAYLRFGLENPGPKVTLMWITEPDHTAHSEGIGAPKTLATLKMVDEHIGRILAGHEEAGLSEEMNVFVTSDHGFSTHTGGANLTGLLRHMGLRDDTVVAGGAIYVKMGGAQRVRKIVEALQGQEWAGPIFTRGEKPDSMEGSVEGTFSFHAVHWDHERSADILVSAAWSAAANEYGVAGSTSYPGVAGHGSASPYDIHATLIAAGPGLKSGVRSGAPTSNVDIAPTICALLDLPIPPSMTGRVIKEALLGGPDVEEVEVGQGVHKVRSKGYGAELHESMVDGKRYFDYARVVSR